MSTSRSFHYSPFPVPDSRRDSVALIPPNTHSEWSCQLWQYPFSFLFLPCTYLLWFTYLFIQTFLLLCVWLFSLHFGQSTSAFTQQNGLPGLTRRKLLRAGFHICFYFSDHGDKHHVIIEPKCHINSRHWYLDLSLAHCTVVRRRLIWQLCRLCGMFCMPTCMFIPSYFRDRSNFLLSQWCNRCGALVYMCSFNALLFRQCDHEFLHSLIKKDTTVANVARKLKIRFQRKNAFWHYYVGPAFFVD